MLLEEYILRHSAHSICRICLEWPGCHARVPKLAGMVREEVEADDIVIARHANGAAGIGYIAYGKTMIGGVS